MNEFNRELRAVIESTLIEYIEEGWIPDGIIVNEDDNMDNEFHFVKKDKDGNIIVDKAICASPLAWYIANKLSSVACPIIELNDNILEALSIYFVDLRTPPKKPTVGLC